VTCALFLTRQCQWSLPFGFRARNKCGTPDPGRRSGSVRRPCGFFIFVRVSARHVAAHEVNRRGPTVTKSFSYKWGTAPSSSLLRTCKLSCARRASCLHVPFTALARCLRRSVRRTCSAAPPNFAELWCAENPCSASAAAAAFAPGRTHLRLSVVGLLQQLRALYFAVEHLPQRLRRLRLGQIRLCPSVLCFSDLGR
jgi:hypothetical protein